MTKADLIEKVKEDLTSQGIEVSKRQVTKTVDATIATIAETMKSGDEILLLPLGRFGTKHRKARKAANMRTGEPIQIPAKFVPNFAPSTKLKDAVGELKVA